MTLLGSSLTLRSLCILSLDEREEAVGDLGLGSLKISVPGKEALMEPQRLKGETTVPQSLPHVPASCVNYFQHPVRPSEPFCRIFGRPVHPPLIFFSPTCAFLGERPL